MRLLRAGQRSARPLNCGVMRLRHAVTCLLKKIDTFLQNRRRRRAAISAALAAFRSSSDEGAHTRMTQVVWSDDTRYIVQVCFGATIPPRRTWFSVTRDGLSVS